VLCSPRSDGRGAGGGGRGQSPWPVPPRVALLGVVAEPTRRAPHRAAVVVAAAGAVAVARIGHRLPQPRGRIVILPELPRLRRRAPLVRGQPPCRSALARPTTVTPREPLASGLPATSTSAGAGPRRGATVAVRRAPRDGRGALRLAAPSQPSRLGAGVPVGRTCPRRIRRKVNPRPRRRYLVPAVLGPTRGTASSHGEPSPRWVVSKNCIPRRYGRACPGRGREGTFSTAF
jgi:hypothetical protein